MKKECAGWYMNSHRRRNQDWQAYGQHRRRQRIYHNLYSPHTKHGRLQAAIRQIKQIYGDDAIITGAEYEQKNSDGLMAD